MWDAHSVVGVSFGLVLFVIFFAGSFALYRVGLAQWADPVLRGQPVLTTDEIVGPLFDERPPEAGSDVTVVYPFGERRSLFLIYSPTGETTDEGDPVRAVLTYSTTTGEEVAPGGQSRLSLILYQLHFLLQLRHILPGDALIGIAIAGILGVYLLFAIITGLLIHLKKLPREWHTFRPRERLRTAVADAHTVLGLVGLPFAVAFAFTGAVIAIMIMLRPQIEAQFFEGDADAYHEAIYGSVAPEADSTGQAAAMLLPDQLASVLPAGWEGIDPIRVVYSRWGDEGATATLYGHTAETLTEVGEATLLAASGEVLVHNPPSTPTALGATYSAVEQLHYADVGGWPLDALFFLLAMATAAVMLTGNMLWVLVRRPKDLRATPWLHHLLARLTAGLGVGLIAATPVLFLLAQLLPADYADRKLWEEAGFFIAWAVFAVTALVGPSAISASRWHLRMAAILCLAVPIANGVMTGGWLWVAVTSGWWATFWIDVGFLIAAPLLWWTAARLPSETAPPARPVDRGDLRITASPLPAPVSASVATPSPRPASVQPL
ncbi:MAG: PepSY-associated TM helix domain-containing protein [Bacteroidota bacterium]